MSVDNIVVSLLASIVGGMISGILVLRKNTHDNKRVYANQMYDDFKLMCEIMLIGARDYITSLGYNESAIKPLKYGISPKSCQPLSKEVKEWLNANLEKEVQNRNSKQFSRTLGYLINGLPPETTGFESFIKKYPLQIARFDDFYRVQSALNWMKKWHDLLDESLNAETTHAAVYHSTDCLLEIINALVKVSEAIEYYRNAKSWTWRLFIPF